MTGWWERFPGRLDYELEAFRERDLDFERDERLFREARRVLLRGHIDDEGERVEFEVLYPDLFPYLRPEVFAPGLNLPRHQTPGGGNLCLLDRPTSTWKPWDTGAWLVDERVRLLLSLFREGPEAMVAAEAPQGEPISSYVPTIPGTVVLVPSQALELDPALKVGSGCLCFAPDTPSQIWVRALLCELVSRPGGQRKTRLLARTEGPLASCFSGQHVQMRWARLEQPPTSFTPDVVLAAANSVQAGFGDPPWQRVSDGEVAITGIVFPEEVRQGEYEDAWVFAVRVRQQAGAQAQQAYVLRGERFTVEDLGARIPKLSPLREATVAQVGLGALGAPLAIELARNQVGSLRLLEADTVEAAQIVRYPLGVPVVGRYKLNAIANFIEYHYPNTRIERFLHKLGQTALDRHARGENELDLVERLLGGASLVIDASAEIRVQQLLSDFARERTLTQLYLSATEGARGGQVVLVVPGAGGCWHCWKAHALDGAIPLPPAEPGGSVQPRGCASPTFTGASFDLLPIVAQAARAAAAAAHPDELRSTAWTCALPADGIGSPNWSTHSIPTHPECPYCVSDAPSSND
jgi:molybdopterin/thiamine biosynthesis adenylyltransferase